MLHLHARALLRASSIATLIAATSGLALAQAPSTAPSPSAPAPSPSLSQPVPPSAMPPGASSDMTSSPGAASQARGSMRPLGAAQAGQMMASDLRGSKVYGSKNENLGDIKDILLDRDGRVAAMVIGVGGFLGIGEKNVALPFEAFDFISGAPSAVSGAAPSTQRDPQTTGTVGADRPASTSSGAASGGQRGSMGTMKPERIVLKNMTRADLEAAPSFGQQGATSTSAPARSGSPAGSDPAGQRR